MSALPPCPRGPARSAVVRAAFAVVALAAVAVAPGCALVRPATDARAHPEATFPARPLDGLLVRPDLQALVDAQVRRDAGPLVAALTSTDAAVRARAAFALASVQNAGAVDALLDRLRDDVPAVRADAAFALGQTGDSTRGVAMLIALRTEATPTVQAELVDALGKTGRAADLDDLLSVVLPATVEPARALAVARMAARGVTTSRGMATVAQNLASPDGALRAASALAFERAPAAAFRDLLPTIRSAYDGLTPADPALASLARALGRAADPQDVGRLAATLATDDNDWRARVAAATALGALGALRAAPAARSALVGAFGDANPHVAAAAATAFARVETPTGDEIAAAVAAVQARRPWQATAPLLPVLARAGRLDAVDAWRARTADPFAQAAYLTALGRAATPATLDLLLARSADPDPRLAAAAIEALRARWAATDSTARGAAAVRYYPAFSSALARRDLATTSAAAPVLSDSAFVALGSADLLRSVYAQMSAPEDVEPMVEIIGALGTIRDGQEVDFLVGVALTGHPVLATAARRALNDRLVEGIDVTARGADAVMETTGIDWTYLARVGPRPRLVLDTDRGQVVIELDAESAPQTVQTIAIAAASGRYDGVPFHRVVSNFVVQGGDYFRRDGYGGPAVPIRSEFTRLRYTVGTAGIASAGKDTEGVQFFVTHSPQPHLDGHYTAFGRVIAGQDVVDRLLQGDLVRRAHIGR
ncbi:MAG TPA: peptidylprolyl isomerase [Rubricoccaceae bacterium]|jgi:peptidylprolyl isomerase